MRGIMIRKNDLLIDSPAIEIKTPGKHRLISEKYLSDLVTRNSSSLLPLPEQVTISFLLRYYRAALFDLQKQELSKKTAVTIGQISKIENGEIKKPQEKTITKLAEVFGEDFKKLATLIQAKED